MRRGRACSTRNHPRRRRPRDENQHIFGNKEKQHINRAKLEGKKKLPRNQKHPLQERQGN